MNRVLVFYEHESFPWVEPWELPEETRVIFREYYGEEALKVLGRG